MLRILGAILPTFLRFLLLAFLPTILVAGEPELEAWLKEQEVNERVY